MPTLRRITPQVAVRRSAQGRRGVGGVPLIRLGRRGSANFTISGTTVDSTGAPLANCTVRLFRAGDDSLVARGVSDGVGAYVFTGINEAGSFYVVSFAADGSLAGSTLPTIAPVAV